MSDEIGSDGLYIRLTCPHCRRQFQKSAIWINANDYVRCDFCREPFGLRSYKTKAAAPVAAATATKPATPVAAATAKKSTPPSPAAKTAKAAQRPARAPAAKAPAAPGKQKRGKQKGKR